MTNLIDNICKIRDLLTEKDYKKITSGIGLFRKTYLDVNRNIERFIKDDNHYLDFNSYDLLEMSMECKELLGELNNQINVNKMVKEITKGESITNESVREFTLKYADIYVMVAHLTEFHNVISYSASLLRVLKMQYEQGELDYVVINAIKNALRG